MTHDPERELRARLNAAMEALPDPDRGRLARIEQALDAERRARGTGTRWLAAALIGAAAAAGATIWTLNTPDTGERTPAPEAVNDTAGKTPAGGRADPGRGGPDQAGLDTRDGQREDEPPDQRDSPVIYQR